MLPIESPGSTTNSDTESTKPQSLGNLFDAITQVFVEKEIMLTAKITTQNSTGNTLVQPPLNTATPLPPSALSMSTKATTTTAISEPTEISVMTDNLLVPTMPNSDSTLLLSQQRAVLVLKAIELINIINLRYEDGLKLIFTVITTTNTTAQQQNKATKSEDYMDVDVADEDKDKKNDQPSKCETIQKEEISPEKIKKFLSQLIQLLDQEVTLLRAQLSVNCNCMSSYCDMK